MGFVHLQRGEVDEAITALHKALTWDPRYVQARATFTSALYMKGEYEKSAEMSRMVLKEQPAFGPAWNNLSLAVFELGDVQKARNTLKKRMNSAMMFPTNTGRNLRKPLRRPESALASPAKFNYKNEVSCLFCIGMVACFGILPSFEP